MTSYLIQAKEYFVSNNHYYTPNDLHDLFIYMFKKIDFTVEDLTTDTGCSMVFSPPPEEKTSKFYEAEFEFYENHEKNFISDVILKTKQNNFEHTYNSHDWVKIYKHAFQHTELVNKDNEEAMVAWHLFSTYFRDACKNNLIAPEQYNLQLKHFMAVLAFNKSELEAKCIHQFLHLASKIYSNQFTKIDSEKVANMLGGVFYTALKIEGIHRPFKLSELDKTQQQSYMENVQKISKVLRYVIEDPFFAKEFNKKQYADFLIVEKPTPISPHETPRIEVLLDEDKLPDESFMLKFKLNSSLEISKDLPIDEFRALHISEKRRSSADNSSKDESGLKVSFSEECLLERPKRRSVCDENTESQQRNDRIEKTPSKEIKKRYIPGSSSLGEKPDQLEIKRKNDFEPKQQGNLLSKSDGDKGADLERKDKSLLFSSSSNPEIKKNKLRSSKEISPDTEIRKTPSNKDLSLSPNADIKKRRLSKDVGLSPDALRKKLRSSKERSLSPDTERRKRRTSKDVSAEPERQELIFSRRSSKSEEASPEIEKRIVPEDQKESSNKLAF